MATSTSEYLKIPAQLLQLRDLTFSEIIVLARIASFSRYYESKEHLADFLGEHINANTCRLAKQKLEQLGYIATVENTGHGKVYRFNFEQFGIEEPKNSSEAHAQAESVTVTHTQSVITVTPYSKVKEKNIVSKETILADKPAEQFGNSNVNEALRLWEDATGYNYASNNYERRAIANLLRRKDIKAHGGFIALVALVKRARHTDNRFAPQIAKPSELGGKYSKYERLLDWQQKQDAQQSAPQRVQSAYAQQDTRIIGTYYKPHPELQETRLTQLSYEDEEKARAERHAEAERIKAELFERLAKKGKD